MRKLVDLQIRRVPSALRDKLRRRARGKGLSMSGYVIQVLQDDLERPTINEWLDEVRRLPRLERLPPGWSGAEVIRAVRQEAEEEIAEEIDLDRR